MCDAGGFVQAIEFIEVLEAAVGIEPTCKGFAVLAKLVAQVQPRFLVSIFVRAVDISSFLVIA